VYAGRLESNGIRCGTANVSDGYGVLLLLVYLLCSVVVVLCLSH
jgi:hypothetical protein